METLNSDVQLVIVLVLVAGSVSYMARYGIRRVRQILSAAQRADACDGCPGKCAEAPPSRLVSIDPIVSSRDDSATRV